MKPLTRLSNVNNPVGSLVRVFPGRSVEDDTDWLDTWFLDKVEQHFDGTIDADNPLNLDLPQVQPQAIPTRTPGKACVIAGPIFSRIS